MENQNNQPKPTIVVVNRGKSTGTAFLLTFLFGPLGLMYVTPLGGILMFFLTIIFGFITLGLGFFIGWLGSILWAVIAAGNSKDSISYNDFNISAPVATQPVEVSRTKTIATSSSKPVFCADCGLKKAFSKTEGQTSFCENCGNLVYDKESVKATLNLCSGCKKPYSEGDSFCENCGTKLIA